MTDTIIVVLIIVAALYFLQRRAMERPAGLRLRPREAKVAELFVKTRDISLGGFYWYGSGREGKLALTNKRLLYCRFDERRIALSLEPHDVIKFEVSEKGVVFKAPALVVDYAEPRKPRGKTRKITWTLLSVAPGIKRYTNPHTAESFAALLTSWKNGALAPPATASMAKNVYIGKEVVREHIEQAIREILRPDEVLLGAFHGQAMSAGGYGLFARYKGGMSLHDYLLVTNSRVIMWARGLLSHSTDGFHYEDISSVEEARGLLLGEVVFNVRGAKERMRNMVIDDVLKAAQMIRGQIAAHRSPAQAPARSTDSIADSIKKLAELRESGILTEEEFSTKKAELLKRL